MGYLCKFVNRFFPRLCLVQRNKNFISPKTDSLRICAWQLPFQATLRSYRVVTTSVAAMFSGNIC